MDDKTIRAAMTGDEKAARECVKAGILLPCPWCGSECDITEDDMFGHMAVCKTLGCNGTRDVFHGNAFMATLAHNRRAKLEKE